MFSGDIQGTDLDYPITIQHLPCDVLIMKELLARHCRQFI